MGSGVSNVRFINDYGRKMWVAYSYRDFGCRDICDDIWSKRGWINLDPGETETRPNPTTNRWYYYYAEAEDGSVWSGPFVHQVSRRVFDLCTCIGIWTSEPTNLYFNAGFREVDVKTFSGVRFVP